MAIELYRPERVGRNAWRVRWFSGATDPTFAVYVNGKLRARTKRTETVLSGDPTETFFVEVMDDLTEQPRYAADNRVLLAFNRLAAASSYSIEHNGGSGFAFAANVPDTAQPRVAMRSHSLDPQLDHQFKVTAIGQGGDAGTPTTVPAKIARHSDVPIAAFTYNAGTKKVTISQGS